MLSLLSISVVVVVAVVAVEVASGVTLIFEDDSEVNSSSYFLFMVRALDFTSFTASPKCGWFSEDVSVSNVSYFTSWKSVNASGISLLMVRSWCSNIVEVYKYWMVGSAFDGWSDNERLLRFVKKEPIATNGFKGTSKLSTMLSSALFCPWLWKAWEDNWGACLFSHDYGNFFFLPMDPRCRKCFQIFHQQILKRQKTNISYTLAAIVDSSFYKRLADSMLNFYEKRREIWESILWLKDHIWACAICLE